MRLTEAEFREVRRRVRGRTVDIAKGKGSRASLPSTSSTVGAATNEPRYKSKLEAQYAQYLDALKYGKELRTWVYEPLKFRLADRCWYTPDFLVVQNDGALELHEVKGWMREDANVKLKVVARLFPWFTFKLVTRSRHLYIWRFTD